MFAGKEETLTEGRRKTSAKEKASEPNKALPQRR